MDKKVFFDALTRALAGNGRVKQLDIDSVLLEISKDYDPELMDKLDNFFLKEAADRNGILPMGKVMSTVAFFMAHTIYDACDTDNQICILAQSYADYLHQSAHGLFREHGISPNKKKLG